MRGFVFWRAASRAPPYTAAHDICRDTLPRCRPPASEARLKLLPRCSCGAEDASHTHTLLPRLMHCIYCGAPATDADPLARQHVLPRFLGTTPALPALANAACAACARTTRSLERRFRTTACGPGRANAARRLVHLGLPHLLLPMNSPERSARRRGDRLPPRHECALLRFIARLAHTRAVQELGADGFKPCLTDLVRGVGARADAAMFIGCEARLAQPRRRCRSTVEFGLGKIVCERGEYWLATVWLFPSQPVPRYLAVVGEVIAA